MFDSSGRKIFIGVVAGTLLSTAMLSVWAADEKETHHLIDSEGKPVLTQRPSECVQTPKTPNQPAKPFKECGDIGDRDGDGVPDDEDQCPDNTPEEISKGVYDDKVPPRHPNNKAPQRECDKIGCPIDSDGDGAPDYRDDCPDTAPEFVVKAPDCARHECVNDRGCVADSDSDGVPDCKDQCPNTKAGQKVGEDGCTGAVEERIVGTLSAETLFDFDKAVLKSQGKRALDELVQTILTNADYQKASTKIQVVGHTDPVGKDAYNQKLSEKRAKAVATYLISKGIPVERIDSEGRGEKELVQQSPGEPKKAWHARCRRVEVNALVKQ